MDEKEKEKLALLIIKAFRQGLSKAESSKIDDVNKDTNALGIYQYVPTYHGDKIKKFAKDKFGVVIKGNDYSKFLTNEAMQEAYMEYDVRNNLVSNVVSMQKKHPKAEYSPDEIAMLLHYNWRAGYTKFVKKGDYEPGKKGTNSSMQTHLDRYRKFRGDDLKIPKHATLSSEDKYDAWRKYESDLNKINSSDFSQKVKTLAISSLNKEAYKDGFFSSKVENNKVVYEGPFNRIIKSIRDDESNAGANKENENKNLFSFISKVAQSSKDNKLNIGFIPNDDIDELQSIIDSNPEFINDLELSTEKGFFNKKTKKRSFKIDPKDIKGSMEKAYNEIKLSKIYSSNTPILSMKPIDKKSFIGKKMNEIFDNNGIEMYNSNGNLNEDIFDNTGGFKIKNIRDLNFTPKKTYSYDLLERNPLWDLKEPIEEPKISKKSTSDPSKYTKEDIKKVKKEEIEIIDFDKKQALAKKLDKVQLTDDDKMINDTDDYYSSFENAPGNDYLDPSKKNNFPFADVISGLAGGVIGLNMAKEKVPLRDEKISTSYLSYALEQKKLSEIGLRPEEEAHAKRMLSESYQSKLQSIVSASAGNRNVVLGNLGRLDAQKQKGLLSISIADAKAKNTALAKYGEAMKYINEFNTDRDIANHSIKYDQAIKNKEAGGKLAQVAFSKMMNDIQHAKDTGPGSAYSVQKDKLNMEVYGFIQGKKGNGPGTKAYRDKQIENKLNDFGYLQDTSELLSKMNNDQKKQFSLFDKQTGRNNKKSSYEMANYIYKNNPSGEIDFKNIGEAIDNNDYGSLFKDINNSEKELPLQTEESSIDEVETGFDPVKEYDLNFNY